MSKKRKIDYIIEERDNRRLIFRFYPRQSSCHSFGNEPPKSWDEVYKVYYSYAIISQWKHEPDSQWESDVKYYEHCDECSIIDEIAQRCLLLAEGYETFEREDGERIPLLDKRYFRLVWVQSGLFQNVLMLAIGMMKKKMCITNLHYLITLTKDIDSE